MKHDYLDIRSRIPEQPAWWDEHGVPRYGAFTPDAVASSALEIILLRIACQSCARRFDVCLTWSPRDRHDGVPALAERSPNGRVEYGDPPNVECCPVGPDMSREALRVLEFWRRAAGRWERVPALEIDVVPGRAQGDA